MPAEGPRSLTGTFRASNEASEVAHVRRFVVWMLNNAPQRLAAWVFGVMIRRRPHERQPWKARSAGDAIRCASGLIPRVEIKEHRRDIAS